MATFWKHTSGCSTDAARDVWECFPVRDDAGLNSVYSESRIVPFRDGDRQRYALIAACNAVTRVNGSVVVGGIRVLNHKDEIVIGAQRMFFSTEATPHVEVYQHGASRRRPRCPVCRAEIQDRHQCVSCPGCSRIYHQIAATEYAPAKLCWTYCERCRFCDHPTSLSGELAWRPDEYEEQ